MNPKQSIFLSYSHADTDIMQRIKTSLFNAGLQIWTDENLRVGTPEWQHVIQQEIENSDGLIVVLSPDAEESKWVAIEISYAEVFDKKIYPVLVRGDRKTSIPIVLINHQYIKITDDGLYESQIRKLIDGIIGVQVFGSQSQRPKTKPQAEYNLWLKHRWEDLQQELHEAEINNDVAAFIKVYS